MMPKPASRPGSRTTATFVFGAAMERATRAGRQVQGSPYSIRLRDISAMAKASPATASWTCNAGVTGCLFVPLDSCRVGAAAS